MNLHNYQRRAVAWLGEHRRAILAIEMGLGKTASVLHYLDAAGVTDAVIVAPKRVAETVWRQEAEKWGLAIADRMTIVIGTKAKRLKAWGDTERRVKVVGRDNLGDLVGRPLTVEVLVLDELTSFKSLTSKRSKYLANIMAERFIGLTGTFLANGAIDIFGQAQAVGLSGRLGSNFWAWRALNFRDCMKGSGLQWEKWVPTKPLAEILAPLKDDIFTLVAADYLDLPPVTEHEHAVELSQSERDAYDSAEAFMAADMGGGLIVGLKEGQIFVKLQTLCNGFLYKDRDGEPGKLEAIATAQHSKFDEVADFCASAYGEGEQVLLFYAYRYEEETLRAMLKARGVACCNVKDRDALERWHRREAGVMLAHPASAGHGLNLQHEGRIIVWSSVTYNFEHFAQANARLARQGQTLPVEIHYFTAKNTIEEAQRRALSKKAREQGTFEQLTKV